MGFQTINAFPEEIYAVVHAILERQDASGEILLCHAQMLPVSCGKIETGKDTWYLFYFEGSQRTPVRE
jgi:hypothetical protein